MNWLEIRLILILLAVLLIPGWAILSITQVWKRWPTLQRWIIAFGLSVCFYPILFYLNRWALPQFHLGLRKNEIILGILGVIILITQRKDWKEQFHFETMEQVALVLFAVTVFSRLWTAHLQPYPAWADSLHHTMLTQIVAATGQLPYTLLPYEPSVLQMYHLGLYAITGVIQQLAKAPATTALLWTAQFLSGLSGLGVYLVLDRVSGRKGAIIGASVVGLLSFQPAWYVNWGRFTQVASQAIMLIAFALTYEAIESWRQVDGRLGKLWLAAIASLLLAGTFLIHFRVAGLLVPLLVIGVLWLLYTGIRNHKMVQIIFGAAVIAIVAILLISPALWVSLRAYIHGVSASADPSGGVQSTAYYDYPLNAYLTLGAQLWLYITALLALLIGLIFRSKLAFSMLIWVLCLWAIGNAYRLGWFGLSFINYTGIMIMFYLPIGVIIGDGAEILLSRLAILRRPVVLKIGTEIFLLVVVLFSIVRTYSIEPFRYFLTPADVNAMSWIEANVPKDAVFAINTYMWLNETPHGTDGGYWIPFFTQRRTTTGTMMFPYAPKDYVDQILTWSKSVIHLTDGPQYAAALCRSGVRYAYVGPLGNFSGPGLDVNKLRYPATRVIYQQDGVTILSLCNP